MKGYPRLSETFIAQELLGLQPEMVNAMLTDLKPRLHPAAVSVPHADL
eukprot:gene50765-67967_t